MKMMARLQIFSILTSLIGSTFVAFRMHGAVPALQYWLGVAAFGGFQLWWIGSILYLRYTKDFSGGTEDIWNSHTLQVFWAGNISTSIFFWLIMPFASESLRYVTIMILLGAVLIEVMGTVRSPRFGPRSRAMLWAPVVMPTSSTLFLCVYGGEHAIIVILFLPGITLILMLLREYIQTLLVRAHDARVRAEADRDARTRFMASASHDLGQPLQSARLFFDQAVRHPERARRERAVREAKDALGAADRQLRSMLDHLRLDAGVLTPSFKIVAVGPLIARVSSLFEPVAALAGVEIKAMPSSLTLRADPDLLERALCNLVDNALRHADARRLLIGTHGGRIWVIDDGRGVAAVDLPQLFEDFAQGSDKGGKERGGFGLGLSSVRRLMALMGGKAGIEVKWQRGSAFFLEFSV